MSRNSWLVVRIAIDTGPAAQSSFFFFFLHAKYSVFYCIIEGC